MTGSNTAARRDPTRIFAKNRRFSVHIACMVVDGVLDGCNFALIYLVIRGVFEGSFTMSSALAMTAAVAAVFVVRLLVYGYGYLQGQIGGARSVVTSGSFSAKRSSGSPSRASPSAARATTSTRSR